MVVVVVIVVVVVVVVIKMLTKNSTCNNDNNSTCAYLGPPLRETCAMQVLDHGKNARIGPLLKTFLGFLDGSHIYTNIEIPLVWHVPMCLQDLQLDLCANKLSKFEDKSG